MVALIYGATLYSVVMCVFHVHFVLFPKYWADRFEFEIRNQKMDVEQFSDWLTTRFVLWPAYLEELCG